jgi:hypothetical protein
MVTCGEVIVAVAGSDRNFPAFASNVPVEFVVGGVLFVAIEGLAHGVGNEIELITGESSAGVADF